MDIMNLDLLNYLYYVLILFLSDEFRSIQCNKKLFKKKM